MNNILQEKVDALVNPVNCVGVCGKGLALEFKMTFPKNYREYLDACQSRKVSPGQMFVTETGEKTPKFIINFPTKLHWKNPSRMEWITGGLANLVTVVMDRKIQSIAIPAIGCGLGGLDWRKIEPEIKRVFRYIPGGIDLIIYDPNKRRYRPFEKEISLD